MSDLLPCRSDALNLLPDIDAALAAHVAEGRTDAMTMLEKIARAVALRHAERRKKANPVYFSHNYPGGIAECVDRTWRNYIEDQRAALQALREPDEAMVKAAGGALKAYIDALPEEERAKLKPRRKSNGDNLGYKLSPQTKARVRMRAMIDAALAEKPEA